MNNKLLLAVLFVGCLGLSFAWGLATWKYQIFPFGIIRLALGGGEQQDPLAERSLYHQGKIELFRQHGRSSAVVMLGSTTIDGAEWQELLPEVDVVNRGIGLDVSAAVLEQLPQVTASGATVVCVMMGMEDLVLGATPETVLANYRTLVDELLAAGMKVHIQSTLLGGVRFAAHNDGVRSINAGLHRLADDTDGVSFLDLNEHFAADGTMDRRYSIDDRHLTAEGYARWRDLLREILPRREVAE